MVKYFSLVFYDWLIVCFMAYQPFSGYLMPISVDWVVSYLHHVHKWNVESLNFYILVVFKVGGTPPPPKLLASRKLWDLFFLAGLSTIPPDIFLLDNTHSFLLTSVTPSTWLWYVSCALSYHVYFLLVAFNLNIIPICHATCLAFTRFIT